MHLLHPLLCHARPTRSQPPPPVASDTTRASSASATKDVARRHDLRATIDALTLHVPIALSPGERAFLIADFAADRAHLLGVRVNALSVARECLRCLALAMPWIVRGRLGDFGTLSARLMLDELLALLPGIAAQEAPHPVPHPPTLTASEVTLARRSLRRLTRRQEHLEAVIARANTTLIEGTRRARAQIRTLVQIAHVRTQVSAGLAANAGLTPAKLDTLESLITRDLNHRQARRESHIEKRSARSESVTAVGRLVLQLRQLVSAVRAQRSVDVTVPTITSVYASAH